MIGKNWVKLLCLGLSLVATVPALAEDMADQPPLQIVNQTGIKVVVQVNHVDVIPKNGVSKQIFGAKNLVDQYVALGMKPGKDFDIVMVFRADGAQFLLNDKAYDDKVKEPHPPGNPNKMLLMAMNKAGVKMYECSVAMKLKGYVPGDLLPFARPVVSGIGAVVDFEKSGYLLITP